MLSPVHHHDLATIRGVYGIKPELPAIGGSELVGVLEERDASPISAGTRIACVTRGAWAEYALADAALLAPVPDAIPDEVACQLLAMPLSAFVLLEELDVKPGEWIVQNAASGAVGRTLMQQAQKRGINAINLVRHTDAERDLRSAGALHVVVMEGDWVERALAAAEGAPIVCAIDSVSGTLTASMQRLLSPGGALFIFGALSGEAMRLDPGLMIYRDLTVRGFWLASWMRRPENGGKFTSAVQRVFESALAGELQLPVAGIYPLTQPREALLAAEKRGRGGKVLFSAQS